MTRDNDFDRLADAWMAEGPIDLADNVLFDALDEIQGTRQRRPLGMAWRPLMSNSMFRAAAVIAVLAVGALTAVGVARSLPATGTTPTPPPSGLPVATAPAAIDASPSPAPSLADGLFAPLGYDGSGTIAFTRSEADGTSAPWLVDPDGTSETRLRIGAGCCPVFSPDGRTIAVGFEEPGVTAPVQVTSLLALDGELVEDLPLCGACGMVAPGLNYEPVAWSHALRRLSVQTWVGSDPSTTSVNIMEVGTPRGTAPGWTENVTGGVADLGLDFSPDGTRMLFIRPQKMGDNSGPLFVLDVATGKVTQVTPDGVRVFADGYFGGGASWSPDGSRIAWAGTDESGNVNRMSVRVSTPDGAEVVTKSPAAAFTTSAHWSPDGAWIAYDAPGVNGLHDLYIVDPDSETTRNLTDDLVPGVCCARWSPDSRALLVAATEGDDQKSVLLAVPVDGSEIRQITTSEGFYSHYSWGPASR